ncbi:anti-sigma factor [Rubellimicrobium roseum]|uniref:Anti-sigma K factor RskA C-terminal domain-containing protein n=1 Tax=Rubellimicrobium roseum TaxID=687525 RepID=A0A5C4NI93_9RHOB|nr:anti-sigma factor [Rubellimicrobium roseum]TNC73832.1 hypothetical protein FHG71_04995 [Rubellimicrobium roseum]
MTLLDYEDDNGLAAEYVLGLLTPDEVREVEERLGIDPEFRALVARWTEDLVSLTDDIPSIAPPRPLEGMVMRRLFPEAEPARRGWGWWPWLLGGVAAAALAVVALNPQLLSRSGQPDYAARIAAEDGSLVVEASFDRDSGRLELRRLSGAAPEGRDLELWLVELPEGTTISLGVLRRDEATTVVEVGPDLAPVFESNALAISEEPLGGSPTGQATGQVLALGPITDL